VTNLSAVDGPAWAIRGMVLFESCPAFPPPNAGLRHPRFGFLCGLLKWSPVVHSPTPVTGREETEEEHAILDSPPSFQSPALAFFKPPSRLKSLVLCKHPNSFFLHSPIVVDRRPPVGGPTALTQLFLLSLLLRGPPVPLTSDITRCFVGSCNLFLPACIRYRPPFLCSNSGSPL